MAEPIHIAPVIHDEHNSDVGAKKVVPISPKGRSVSYEDTNFIAGDSPALLDVNGDLDRDGHDGYLISDGNGEIEVEVSDDGVNYGGTHTLGAHESLFFENVCLSKVRLTHVNNSAYRAFFI